jgi:hypothetical protein
MLRRNLIGASLLAIAASGTFAVAETDGDNGMNAIAVQGPHAKMTVVPNARMAGIITENDKAAGMVTIFSSLASKYPKGVYWCCTGYNVMGANSGAGVQWMGGAFTPKADHTLTRIEIAVGYSGQGVDGVVISVNEDNAGIPGKALKTWSASGLPFFGTCCTVVVKTDKTGIPLSGGKQYWIVLSTNSKETDTVDGWNVSDADQIDQAKFASYDGSVWHTFQTAPGLAFAVKGSN